MVCHAARAPKIVGICGLLFGVALLTWTAPAPAQAPAATGSTQHPLDQPLAWLNEAKRNHAAIRDYTCTMVSRENIRGVLHEESVVSFKMRTQPFSVSMRWLAPREQRNQEVCFVLGRPARFARLRA
jgi:hypothetical protein